MHKGLFSPFWLSNHLVKLDSDTFRANLLKYTSLAFSLLPRLDNMKILDAGCGTGVPTIHLAELSDGPVVAIDTDGDALAKLAERLTLKGLSSRVTLVNAPMEIAAAYRELPHMIIQAWILFEALQPLPLRILHLGNVLPTLSSVAEQASLMASRHSALLPFYELVCRDRC